MSLVDDREAQVDEAAGGGDRDEVDLDAVLPLHVGGGHDASRGGIVGDGIARRAAYQVRPAATATREDEDPADRHEPGASPQRGGSGVTPAGSSGAGTGSWVSGTAAARLRSRSERSDAGHGATARRAATPSAWRRRRRST